MNTLMSEQELNADEQIEGNLMLNTLKRKERSLQKNYIGFYKDREGQALLLFFVTKIK